MTARNSARLTGWTTALPAGAGRLLQEARGGGAARSAVAVQGPGGTGKSVLLQELAAAYRSAGIPVADVRSAPAAADLTGDLAVIVDDAQRLTLDGAARVRGLLDHPRARVALAYRPWPRPPALAELVQQMAGDRHMVVLGHLPRDVVQTWAAAELGAAATPRLVDFVLHQTGGLPALVASLLGGLAHTVAGRADAPAGDRGAPQRLEVPGEVADRVRGDLAALDDEERALLHALAAGSPLDAEVLGDLLEVGVRRATDLVTRARAGGLLLGEGLVVPLVQDALLQETPADVTRGTRRRLLGLLLDRGDDPLDLARALAADRVREPRAAQLLERHGTAALTASPELAAQLLAEAADAGAPAGRLAARRAQAAALTGDLDGALQWADRSLTDEEAPDRGRAAGVAGAVLAQRGLLARSAELFALAGPERTGSAALALLATGASAEAVTALQAATDGASAGVPTTLSGGEWLMAQGVLRSLRRGASAADDIAASLSVLTRAAALLEPVGRTALLPDTPAALAALVALHSGELGVAESVLCRAITAEVGGPPARPRHLLLLAWTAMLRGRIGSAREHLAQAQSGGHRLEPRDELFLRALQVGLARRTGDAPAMASAWEPAREALLRHPVDLFALLPLGELVIAGARMKDAGRLAPHVAEARALLERLGDPQLWATPLHWSGVQAAILADDPAALEPHAAALAAAARTSPYAATVAQAGRSWLRVLSGDVDVATAVVAATDLAAVGLAWDGSQLAGQAAARATDPRDRMALLQCARSLAGSEEPGGRTRTPVPEHPVSPRPEEAQLSQRERDVAALVVAGQTYREIGVRLFISAKTVEHHVARMRQRLGANSRSDLIARLQAELADRS